MEDENHSFDHEQENHYEEDHHDDHDHDHDHEDDDHENKENPEPRNDRPYAHSDRFDGDADNERVFDFHQKRLQEQGDLPPQPPHHQRPSRSTSFLGRTHDTAGHSSVAPTDAASNLRFRSIISSARYSAMRRSVGGGSVNYDNASAGLTEGERIAMEQMAEREERRQSALHRAAEEEERREQMLIQNELQKEAATLQRIVELEEKKQQVSRERQERTLTRMEQAKQRRLAMERERQAKLDEIQRRREERLVHRDPYAAFLTKGKYRGPSTLTSD
ncbi:uncharacterized protein TM35_000461210 [Trypanosoma theileri]|uniref:Uncharacterized protein n=1 Tax=Trypanosoma theileri TaxID=67003 RepID=A0A1X0NHR6_9TRYP|nr:uncharacterized protein TM35_000461210 [Trypanosoma theileri]ORC84302.1 hypothetical protein TM35_000461210 [Trypanosoma theileri]